MSILLQPVSGQKAIYTKKAKSIYYAPNEKSKESMSSMLTRKPEGRKNQQC